MRYVIACLLAVAIALVAAGCGGPEKGALERANQKAPGSTTEESEDHEDAVPNAASTTQTSMTPPGEGGEEGDADPQLLARGKELFTDSCGSCHALADAGTSGTVGPNLDDLAPNRDETLKQIDEGGGGMPADIVTGDDAEAVAAYVAASAGK